MWWVSDYLMYIGFPILSLVSGIIFPFHSTTIFFLICSAAVVVMTHIGLKWFETDQRIVALIATMIAFTPQGLALL